MCGALAPLADLTKTRIYELARWINANFEECGYASPPIPQNSIDKPPSAELRPNQTDQDTLPPYDVLDQIIERRIELEQGEATILAESGIDPSIVRKSLGMIDRAQFKRDQAPVVLKVTGRAFGRGRPMPIVMRERTTIEAQQPGENLTDAQPPLAEHAKVPQNSRGAKENGQSKPPRKSNAPRKKADADL
jgi:NAD+ synthase (glutamine-hydrolysing)